MVTTRASTTPARARVSIDPTSADSVRPLADKVAFLLSTDPSLVLKQALTTLLDSMGITEWEDFSVHVDADFQAMVDGDDSIKSVVTASHVKRLSVICSYAQFEPYNTTVTFQDIVRFMATSRNVTTATVAQLPPLTPMPTQPPVPVPFSLDSLADSTAASATVKALKDVPDLKSFNGAPEDYRLWADKTLDTLGRCLLDDYCLKQDTVDANPKLAHGVFCAISASLRNGLAKSHVDELKAANDFNPVKLWNKLSDYYNTPLNKTLTLIAQMRRLMDLRLDGNISPTKFITDWKDAVLKISEVNSDIGSNHHLLRAMLFVAMSDEDYNPVRDAMMKDDTKDYYQILQAIREREEMLDGQNRLKELSSSDGIRSRRTSVPNSRGDNSNGPAPDGRWYIPLFPKSWFVHDNWKTLLAWRAEAIHNNTSQHNLNDKFNMQDKQFTKGSNNSTQPANRSSSNDTSTNRRHSSGDNRSSSTDKKRRHYSKSRRTSTNTAVSTDDADTDHSSYQSDEGDAKSKRSTKRIKLQHKRNSDKIKFEKGA